MMKGDIMKTTKKSLFASIVALLLCLSMLLGTTFAWFSDSVKSENNIITTGELKIGMYWSKNNVDWQIAEGDTANPIFSHDNWEPGYTEVRYIKVTNEGSLAFEYQMLLDPNGEVDKLAEVIDVSFDIVTDNPNFVAPTADNKAGSLAKIGTLEEILIQKARIDIAVIREARGVEGKEHSFLAELLYHIIRGDYNVVGDRAVFKLRIHILVGGIGGVFDLYLDTSVFFGEVFVEILFKLKVRVVRILRSVGDIFSPVVNVKNYLLTALIFG